MIALTECRTAEEVRALARLVSQKRKEAFAIPLPTEQYTNIPETATVIPIEQDEESVAMEVVEGFLPCWPIVAPPPSIRRVMQVVADYYQITILDLLSVRRNKGISHPRQVAFYLCSSLTKYGFQAIGRSFHKDHTTVMHGARMVKRRMEHDPALVIQIEELKRVIG